MSKDLKDTNCNDCKKGTYIETSQFDDMDGVLHCSKCGVQVKRWLHFDCDCDGENGLHTEDCASLLRGEPIPHEVYKDFEQGQPFKDER